MFGNDKKLVEQGGKKAESHIGTTVQFKGDIVFAQTLFFDGNHKGSMSALNDKKSILIVGKNAKIKGDINVTKIIILGHVDGNIYSDGLVTLMPGSKVQGDIYYKDVDMRYGASMNGSFCHTGGKPLDSGQQNG